ncbi:MAG: ABC transporter ATP-binding protein [Pseudomonadota bacterium]
MLAAGVACLLPFLFVPALTERDLQVRDASAALSRFYLDALLGVRAVQAHAAEQALRDAQAPQLRQWLTAGLRQQSLVVRAETIQLVVAIGAVITLVCRQMATVQQPASLLLLVYWALSLVLLGQQAARLFWTLPSLRNTLLRLMELLNAPAAEPAIAVGAARSGGVKVELEAVDVVVAGRRVLERISLHVQPGEHVAVVGPSGAGKSSLVGLLLGWYSAAAGRFHVDECALDAAALAQLRMETVWIDPQVHLFHDSLFDNLVYGNGPTAAARWRMRCVTRHWPGCWPDRRKACNRSWARTARWSPAARDNACASVAASAASRHASWCSMNRHAAWIAKRARNSSPTRGSASPARRCFTSRMTSHRTQGFDRVVVVEEGRIREQGAPGMLYQQEGSRYRQLLEQESAARRQLWSSSAWRHLRLREGRVVETRDDAQPRQLRA